MGFRHAFIVMHGLSALALFVLPAGWLGAQGIDYSRLEREVIRERLERVEPENVKRLEVLRTLFHETGCKDESLTEMEVPGSDLPNIVCTLPGESGSTIIVGAHYDRPPEGNGIVDNWSGAALLPSLYQSASRTKHRHTYVFVGFAGGSQGDLGSTHYAKSLTKDQVSRTLAMINLDCLGLSFTRMWQPGRKTLLAAYFKQIANSIKLPTEHIAPAKIKIKDAEPFLKHKIPAITVHSVTKLNRHVPQGGEDTLESVEKFEYYETYMLLTAYLAFLDTKLEPAQ